MKIDNVLSKVLGNDKVEYHKIKVDKKVINEIIKIARNADPNEYMALLSGKIEDEILKITGLIFLPFEASSTSAVMQVFMIPITSDAIGSIHSHPGPSAQASNADLTFFSKNGLFHMIICQPYNEFTIRAYDTFGKPVEFEICDLTDDINIKELDINEEEFYDPDLKKELEELEQEEAIKEMEDINEEEIAPITQPPIQNSNEQKTFTINLNPNDPYIPPQINPLIPNQKIATVKMEIPEENQVIERQIVLPPEFKDGDELIINIITDENPININENKPPLNNTQQNEPITVPPTKTMKNDLNELNNKTKEEIEKDIQELEEKIKQAKEDNKRLKENR
ncbi:MAG: Mov34/MPN/PAD-1 family protein [Methanobacteriaceae archaeon]|nr:Mov34/MPN/PAD-1 family protein [Methanobacteriaceae archaeon]